MSDLIAKLTDLEERLLGTWTRRPSLRDAWTPEPAEFFSVKSQAVAAACGEVSDLEGNDLGTALIVALNSAGKLKLWGKGQPVVHHQDLVDPVQALAQWRDLKCLVALRAGLASALEALDAGTDLPGSRERVLEALRASESASTAKAYSDLDLMMLAREAVTTQAGAGSATGFDELDRVTGGIRPGHVWTLGAPTNWGKTNFAIALVDHYQLNNRRALIVTCEDAPELLATRLLCRRANIPGDSARDGKLTTEHMHRVDDEIGRAIGRGAVPVMIDGRGRAVELLAGDIRTAVRAHGITLVIVDYLQCISSQRVAQDRRAEINHITRTLTDAIKTSGCAGMLTSQLTGEDIRESRDVEHGAEVVLIGRKGDDGSMSLFVKKSKTGKKDMVLALDWDPVTGSFRSEPKFAWDGYTDA